MLAFISAHGSVLLLSVLTLASELMGLSKNPVAAKGLVDGLIKFLQGMGSDSGSSAPPSVPPAAPPKV